VQVAWQNYFDLLLVAFFFMELAHGCVKDSLLVDNIGVVVV